MAYHSICCGSPIIIVINNECHRNIIVKVAATAKSCGKVKVSHAAVKSFDRRGVSCKNARTVQFSGGVEKCPVTQKTALPVSRDVPMRMNCNFRLAL